MTARRIDIWQDPRAAAFVRSVTDGNETVPTVVVAGQAMVNPHIDAVKAALRQAALDTDQSQAVTAVHPPAQTAWQRVRSTLFGSR
nr:hypothetical protein [Phytoactinopolyspora endophytica]